jgi:hypothetical protein
MACPQPLECLLPHLSRPLCLIDVGARWGVASYWERLAENAKVICFEPDQHECHRLNANKPKNTTYLPIALSSHDGTLRMTITILWRISDLVHYAPSPVIGQKEGWRIVFDPIFQKTVPAADGQLFWAQAQYVRTEFPCTGVDYLEREKALAAAAIVGSYNHWDLALELIRESGDTILLKQLTTAVAGSVPKLDSEQHKDATIEQLQAENARLAAELHDALTQRHPELNSSRLSHSSPLTSALRSVKDWLFTKTFGNK